MLFTAVAVYWYRNELRIIGRGVMAGANLAIERWETNKAAKKSGIQSSRAREGFKKQRAEKEKAAPTPSSERIACVPGPIVLPPHTHSATSPSDLQHAVDVQTENVLGADTAAFIGLSQSEDGSPSQAGEVFESLEHIREMSKRLLSENARIRKVMEDLQECMEIEEGWMDCHEAMEEQ
jgi:hypothetical protein